VTARSSHAGGDLQGATWLFVPGGRERYLRRARTSRPTAVVLDLEDGLDQSDLPAARERVRQAGSALAGGPAVFVRTHGAADVEFAGDVEMALSPELAGVVLPKVEEPSDVVRAEDVLRDAAREADVIVSIESPRALENVGAILAASPRVVGVAFGAMDFSAELGLPPTQAGGSARPAGPAPVLEAARLRLVLAAAARGVTVRLDAPPLSWDDPSSLEAEARHAFAMGFTGRLLIHPDQVEPTRRGFAPSDEELRWALAVVRAAEERSLAGIGGAFEFEGRMVDEAILRQARRLVARRDV
jgi:citrate lyase beta subunit